MNWKVQSQTFGVGLLVAGLATIASLLVCWALALPTPSLLEAAAVATSFGCTFLFVLQRRQAYLWGAVTTVLYCWLFFQYELPGSAVVQLYLLGALVYGFFRWGPDGDPRPVTLVTPRVWWIVYLGLSATTWYGAVLISESMGTPVPVWDSSILALSVLAQWLLDNKKLETWPVWIVINVIAVPLYWSQGLSLVAAQYVLFLVNAVWAFFVWRRSMHSTRSQGRHCPDESPYGYTEREEVGR